MNLNSIKFILFFALVYLGLYFVKDIKKRNIILLLVSFAFYIFSSIKFAILLLLFITLIYLLSLKENKNCLKIGIIISVLMLGTFKYFNFFVDSFSKVLGLSLNTVKILIPLGVSFYVFRAISYLVDIYRGKYKAEKDFVLFALYISYFPEMISGPISRFDYLSEQFKENNQNIENLLIGIQMFVIGLFKKVVIADNLAVFVAAVFDNPEVYNSLSVVLAVIAYSIEIYMDFSGYSDMSIGVSKALGYDIKKNFDMPYISKSVTEFWKRWHISLSSWLQEYVYYPLGGNRKGVFRQYLNLFLTMTIGGLWHGASWTFVVWGALQGLALIVHKLFMVYKKKSNLKDMPDVVTVMLTMFFITLSWIPFRASSFGKMLIILKKIFIWSEGLAFYSSWAIVMVLIVTVTYLFVIKQNKNRTVHSYYPVQNLETVKGLFVFFLLIASVICFGYTGGSPFIYAAF
ncbi:MAG: MBOAT family O-acyltransferase [Erysipelotrichaceae bacterium]|nr:MBOAT family O-acyltransferase [Erysipelotrichaceae bacterium]